MENVADELHYLEEDDETDIQTVYYTIPSGDEYLNRQSAL